MRICVRQMGGLGNQMFQYAAGLFYAHKYRAELQISLDPPYRAFSFGVPRPFQLSHYGITVPTRRAGRLELLMQIWNPQIKPAGAVLRKVLNAGLIAEPKWYCFWPDLPVRSTANQVYMRGYWQAAGYAEGVASRLRSELVLRHAPAGRDLEVLQEVKSSTSSVSIHVRRGDYLLWRQGSVVLPLSYYRAAIGKILDSIAEPTFFIFSDDIEFARQHLPHNIRKVFVDHNRLETGYEDLRLMAACEHNIIANSTFSWWAAWLNPNPRKMVLAPKYWLCSRESYYPDLYPADWILLDNLEVARQPDAPS